MTPTLLFYIIIAILVVDFAVDLMLTYLNAQKFDAPIPKELEGLYDEEAYRKSQAYKKANYRFGLVNGFVTFTSTLLFLILGGFQLVDNVASSISEEPIINALCFFGIILLVSDILGTPFEWYHTFVIEERFDFNKTNKRTFITDKLKGWLLTIVIGGVVLSLIIFFFQLSGSLFWLYTWGLVTILSVFAIMFYSRLIVPLFNKRSPIEEGELKTAIKEYAENSGFKLNHIYVIDGSKRSTKANAYFSGIGSEKQITLYDTLIKDLKVPEIVAVLAHEVGHYKKNHVLYNLIASTLSTGITLFILGIFLNYPELSTAIGVKTPSFHAGLITFGILYTPISRLTGLIMNYFSRKFEYEADAYVKETYNEAYLIEALKKLSKNSLSNLNPHPAYIFTYYSHPTLRQRIKQLKA
ncbi:M48 family metallopeptidase [Ascidiimonas sp. W6]|uniref:M48 family metallopeptidase n=1 Tax=Ascidiimonas meishanensis TaxID=3128903 RepID=UPI0030ED0278